MQFFVKRNELMLTARVDALILILEKFQLPVSSTDHHSNETKKRNRKFNQTL
jgi:hypothetical protein